MESVQSDINPMMRSILLDWLVEVGMEYRLSSDTLFLSAAYIDRFLSLVDVKRNRLQLVGVTAMLVASKYEEIYAPQVDEFCYITDNTYTREQVLETEREVLRVLDFDLTQPTTKTFLRRYIKAASGARQPPAAAAALLPLPLLPLIATRQCSRVPSTPCPAACPPLTPVPPSPLLLQARSSWT